MARESPEEGSSPLARGLLVALVIGRVKSGIIPARAGFTLAQPESGFLDEDHPRSRGVYCTRTMILLSVLGSSPLARGLRNIVYGSQIEERIIPARAGFTRLDATLN